MLYTRFSLIFLGHFSIVNLWDITWPQTWVREQSWNNNLVHELDMTFSATPAALWGLWECKRTHHLVAYVDKIFRWDRTSKCWKKKEKRADASSLITICGAHHPLNDPILVFHFVISPSLEQTRTRISSNHAKLWQSKTNLSHLHISRIRCISFRFNWLNRCIQLQEFVQGMCRCFQSIRTHTSMIGATEPRDIHVNNAATCKSSMLHQLLLLGPASDNHVEIDGPRLSWLQILMNQEELNGCHCVNSG